MWKGLPQSVWTVSSGGPAGPACASPQGQQRQQHRLQVAPLLGQPVLEALGVLAVAAALDDALLDQASRGAG